MSGEPRCGARDDRAVKAARHRDALRRYSARDQRLDGSFDRRSQSGDDDLQRRVIVGDHDFGDRTEHRPRGFGRRDDRRHGARIVSRRAED